MHSSASRVDARTLSSASRLTKTAGQTRVPPGSPHSSPPHTTGTIRGMLPGASRGIPRMYPRSLPVAPRSLPVATQVAPGGSPGCSRWPPAADGILGGSGGCFRGHPGGYRGVPGGTNVNFNYPNGEIRSKSPKNLSLNAGLTSRKPQLQIPGYRFHRNPPGRSREPPCISPSAVYPARVSSRVGTGAA